MAKLGKLPKAIADRLEQQPEEDFLKFMYRQDEVVTQLEKEGHTILRVPYADSYAQYLIISKKPLVIAHLPVSDAWVLPPSFIRGLRLKDIFDGVAAGLPRD